MKIEQIYTGCLAHAAYYIENNGEAAIFDPLREVQPYLDRAKKDNAKIKYVFETHFHADFVSGHLDLQKKTGATIVFGPTANPNYNALIATDNQIFKIGDYKIKLLHTPGHTMESSSFLLIDENNNEKGIITGDTLFICDVGRPDLAQHVASELTEELLAGHLFDSLRNKIMPLSDKLTVYPNHGAGSACGKMMSKETTDTLGHQKKVNYALRADMTKEEFIKEVLTGLSKPPAYFPQNVLMNIKGYDSLDSVLARAKKPLNPINFEVVANETAALLLDTRDATDYAQAHIPNSINIGINGNFAQWVGEMIPDVKQEILLITYPNREEESITRLSRVGYDNTIGFLEGGFPSWKKSHKQIDRINRITNKEFEVGYKAEMPLIVDIRKRSEYNSEHVLGAINVPLNEINQRLAELPKEKSFILYCAGGYRSMIAASILKQRGWDDFADVIGGFADIKKTSLKTSTYISPTTQL
ncbi:MBL fold metallo-hydrolase [uncultured Maribacter sp.]|uniref:MBL fold metallo-hydrolase n=1 Tax=uncultured Maribacter sp. TaxID=431308 RepID=UPI00263579C0|nr:MBL fold metallo-hydrolase [uncultured Maribacter sp.]